LVKLDHKSLHGPVGIEVVLELVVDYNDIVSTLMTLRKDVMAETEDPCAAGDVVFHRTCDRFRQLGSGRLDGWGETSAIILLGLLVVLFVIWTWMLGINCDITPSSGDQSDQSEDEKYCADRPHEAGKHSLVELSGG